MSLNIFFRWTTAVNQHGALQVDEFLRVKGHEHVYAIGDINDVAEEKQAYTAKLQVDVLIANLKSSAKVGNPKKPYKPSEWICPFDSPGVLLHRSQSIESELYAAPSMTQRSVISQVRGIVSITFWFLQCPGVLELIGVFSCWILIIAK